MVMPKATGNSVVAISCQLGKYGAQPSKLSTGADSNCRIMTQRFIQTPSTARITASHKAPWLLRPLLVIRIAAGMMPQRISRIRIHNP